MRDWYERRGALYSSEVESSSSLLAVRLRALSSSMLRPLYSRMLGALYSSRVESSSCLYESTLGERRDYSTRLSLDRERERETRVF